MHPWQRTPFHAHEYPSSLTRHVFPLVASGVVLKSTEGRAHRPTFRDHPIVVWRWECSDKMRGGGGVDAWWTVWFGQARAVRSASVGNGIGRDCTPPAPSNTKNISTIKNRSKFATNFNLANHNALGLNDWVLYLQSRCWSGRPGLVSVLCSCVVRYYLGVPWSQQLRVYGKIWF